VLGRHYEAALEVGRSSTLGKDRKKKGNSMFVWAVGLAFRPLSNGSQSVRMSGRRHFMKTIRRRVLTLFVCLFLRLDGKLIRAKGSRRNASVYIFSLLL